MYYQPHRLLTQMTVSSFRYRAQVFCCFVFCFLNWLKTFHFLGSVQSLPVVIRKLQHLCVRRNILRKLDFELTVFSVTITCWQPEHHCLSILHVSMQSPGYFSVAFLGVFGTAVSKQARLLLLCSKQSLSLFIN